MRRFPCKGQTVLRIHFQTVPGFPVKVLSCKSTDVFGLQVGTKCKNITSFSWIITQTSAVLLSAEQGEGYTQTCYREDTGVMGPIITPAFTNTWGGAAVQLSAHLIWDRERFKKKKPLRQEKNRRAEDYGVSTGRRKKKKEREISLKPLAKYICVHVAKISCFFSHIKGERWVSQTY